MTCGMAVWVSASLVASVAADTITSRSGDVLAADDGCAPGAACGLGLLQHRAALPTAVKPAATLVQEADNMAKPENWECPPWLCSTASTTPRPLALELVHEVYTYGAPATHAHPFVNAARADGCFLGLRSYNENLLGAFGEIHQVDAAAMNNYYPHATTPSVVLHWDQDSYFTPCNEEPKYGHPAWPQRGSQVYEEWRLHHEVDYTDRLNHVTVDGKMVADEEPFLSARNFILFAFKSYDTTENAKAAIHEKLPDWTLVQKVVYRNGGDSDPVMIIQHGTDLQCALVFTGTNDVGEFSTSTTQYGTGYCGYKGVHVGYRNELWTLTGSVFPQLRPTLERCSRVTCVGHSLGGSLCELFAACANSGNYTDPDFQRLAWTPKTPELMAELHNEDELLSESESESH